MDTARGYEDVRHDGTMPGGAQTIGDPTEGGVGEAAPAIGSDERRMHVRAYNHWVSLLRDRPYPAIADLDPARIVDFGPNSVLLDFTGGLENPIIQFLGSALRAECGVDVTITSIAQVPPRSLLSRLTDHYLQIIANRAPIGFEAEFVGIRGHNTFYRGILMPFSSDAETIDYIYGVINWKEMVAADEQAQLDAELAASMRTASRSDTNAPVWADGPGAGHAAAEADAVVETGLPDRLAMARESAAAARAAQNRSHAALYRAIGRAYDFARATRGREEDYRALLDDAGIAVQARAPMTAVAKLVFGADHDKTRLTEIATVLAHALRRDVPEGALARLLEAAPGGIKGIVADERAARRPRKPVGLPAPIAARPALASVPLDTGLDEGAAVVLLGRVGSGGTIEVVGSVANDAALARRVLGRLG